MKRGRWGRVKDSTCKFAERMCTHNRACMDAMVCVARSKAYRPLLLTYNARVIYFRIFPKKISLEKHICKYYLHAISL